MQNRESDILFKGFKGPITKLTVETLERRRFISIEGPNGVKAGQIRDGFEVFYPPDFIVGFLQKLMKVRGYEPIQQVTIADYDKMQDVLELRRNWMSKKFKGSKG